MGSSLFLRLLIASSILLASHEQVRGSRSEAVSEVAKFGSEILDLDSDVRSGVAKRDVFGIQKRKRKPKFLSPSNPGKCFTSNY